MNKLSCGIIKDLLPLYVDNVCSEESKTIIEEHIADCPICEAELMNLQSSPDVKAEIDTDINKAVKNAGKRIKKGKKKAVVKTLSITMTVLLVVSIFAYLVVPIKAAYHSYCDDGYLYSQCNLLDIEITNKAKPNYNGKWADIYTVVTWDQRNSGKSYDASQKDTPLTKEMFMTDGKELTEFILEYLSKDKITILGHSWGTIFGANLVLEYPEYYDCFIGTGQLVDYLENEEAFKQEAMIWAKDDEEALQLVNQLTPNHTTVEHFTIKNKIMQKYGYDMMVNGADYNLITTIIFNPNYSITDWINFFNIDMGSYLDFYTSEEFASFSLKGKFDYQVPFYNINGDKDYQTNHKLAEQYFEQVNAPYKQLYIMENMTHGLLESDSEGFSEIVHQIAEMERER